MTWCGASDDAAFDRVKQSKACDERASSRFGPVNQMAACERSGAVLDDAHSFASGGMSLWVDMVERRGPLTPLIPAGSLGCSIDFFQCVTERNHGASVATGNMKGKFPSKRPQASGLIATDAEPGLRRF